MKKKKLNKYELVNTVDLIPYARNARKHSEKQITQIAASIKEFGFINPVIIDKYNGIIAGHGRVSAAYKLNIDQCPCVRVEHLSDAQKRAYILADNKLALNADWDEELLKIELDDLRSIDFDVASIGFDIDVDNEFEPDLPDENNDSKSDKKFTLTVTFENEDEQQLLFCELRDRGLKVKV
jgi:hypothetical protein